MLRSLRDVSFLSQRAQHMHRFSHVLTMVTDGRLLYTAQASTNAAL